MTDLARTAVGDLNAISHHIADGYSIPYNWYYDPEVYRFETQGIWRNSWQVAGPLEKVAEAGDHMLTEAAGIPIVVVRDKDTTLRAFVNVCRHRGYPVARADGNRKNLMCQYHAWTYNLDGTLKGAPGCQLDPTFKIDEIALAPVAVDVLAGVVFVNPDANAQPLRQAHPTIDSWASELKLDLTQFKWSRRMTYTVPGNWKLVYENASECYHCSTIHPTSLVSQYDPAGEREICDEQLVIAHAPRHDKNGQGIRAIMGFPGFVVQQDDYVALSAQIIPDSAGNSRFVADAYGNPDVTEEELAEHYELWDKTFQEDMDAVAAVFAGVSSGAVPFGRLVVPREERTSHLQRVMVEAYRRAADGLAA